MGASKLITWLTESISIPLAATFVQTNISVLPSLRLSRAASLFSWVFEPCNAAHRKPSSLLIYAWRLSVSALWLTNIKIGGFLCLSSNLAKIDFF